MWPTSLPSPLATGHTSALPASRTPAAPLQGQYASDEDFARLSDRMAEGEAGLARADRLFYLSIPPNIFTAVAAAASRAASSRCAAARGALGGGGGPGGGGLCCR